MEEEEIKARFTEEIKSLGITKNSIAETIGFSAQTFTNVSSGRNMPGVLLLSRIKKHFPSFDSNYVITGIRGSDDTEEVRLLKEENRFQKAILSKLIAKTEGALLWPERDKEFRRDLGKAAIAKARRGDQRKNTKSISVRVQGAKIPTLTDLFK